MASKPTLQPEQLELTQLNAALKAENLKLHKRIVSLETKVTTLTARIEALTEELKNRPLSPEEVAAEPTEAIIGRLRALFKTYPDIRAEVLKD